MTDRIIHAYNQRDRVAIRALLLPVLEYVRPGGGKLTTADEVMAQYERDWAVLSSSSVEVRQLVESVDGTIAEITIRGTMSGRPLAVEGVVAHLTTYRLSGAHHDKNWTPRECLAVLVPRLETFVQQIDPAKESPKLRPAGQRLRVLLDSTTPKILEMLDRVRSTTTPIIGRVM